MTLEQTLGIIGLLVTILAIGVTVLGGYVGYLTHTLQGRLEERVDRRLEEDRSLFGKQIAARLALIDASFDLLAGGEVDEGRRSQLYLMRHVARLASGDPQEIRLALRALEGAGAELDPLLAYVERVRSVADWPSDCHEAFERLLRAARDRHSSRGDSQRDAG